MTTYAPQGEVLGSGDPSSLLSEADVYRIVQEHVDTLALDGQRLLVLIPDSTRSAPLPLLFDALRAAFGERVAATGIPEEECTALGVGYLDPDRINLSDYADREDEGVLLVPKAGEMLSRLRQAA